MNASSSTATGVSRALIDYTQWMYALYALSILIALTGAYSVAVRFAFGLPSIVAVIMGYARRAEVRGTWLESHFRWQIHTFWYSWLWIIVATIVALPLLIVVIGLIIEILALAAIGVWVSYRVVRGWLALRQGRPMPVPR